MTGHTDDRAVGAKPRRRSQHPTHPGRPLLCPQHAEFSQSRCTRQDRPHPCHPHILSPPKHSGDDVPTRKGDCRQQRQECRQTGHHQTRRRCRRAIIDHRHRRIGSLDARPGIEAVVMLVVDTGIIDLCTALARHTTEHGGRLPHPHRHAGPALCPVHEGEPDERRQHHREPQQRGSSWSHRCEDHAAILLSDSVGRADAPHSTKSADHAPCSIARPRRRHRHQRARPARSGIPGLLTVASAAPVCSQS